MFAIVLVAAGLGGGFHLREHPAPPPISAPRCMGAECGSSPEFFKAPVDPPPAPVRECPADSSGVTVRPGVRYCIPDRPIRE